MQISGIEKRNSLKALLDEVSPSKEPLAFHDNNIWNTEQALKQKSFNVDEPFLKEHSASKQLISFQHQADNNLDDDDIQIKDFLALIPGKENQKEASVRSSKKPAKKLNNLQINTSIVQDAPQVPH